MNRKPTLANRADLLRGWQRCPDLAFTEVAHLLGYSPELFDEKNSHQQEAPVDCSDSQPLEETTGANSCTIPDKTESTFFLPKFYRLEARKTTPRPDNALDDPEADLPACLRGLKPFQPGELSVPENPEAPLEGIPLVPEARLLPFLRRCLSQLGAKRLDVPKLIKKVSQVQPLYRIPLQDRRMPAGRVCILLDRNARVLPFWEDYHALCSLVERRHGKVGLEIRVLDDNPGGAFMDWFDSHSAQARHQPKPPQAWWMPDPNTVILILSDLGLLAKPWSVIRQHWLKFGKSLQRNGLQAIALIPMFSPAQSEAWQAAERELLNQFCPFVWDKTSRFNDQPLNGQDEHRSEKLERLLGLVSPALHVEPELLRAISYLLPADEADNGLEAAVWLHGDVIWGYTAFSLQPHRRSYYQARFSKELPHLQQQVLLLIKRHHADQFPGVWAEELLQATRLMDVTLLKASEIQQAEELFRRFTCTYYQQPDNLSMRQYAERHLGRMHPHIKTQHPYASVLFALTRQERLRMGAAIPAEYDSQIVHAVVSTKIPASRFKIYPVGNGIACEMDGPITHQDIATFAPLADFTSSSNVVTLGVDGKQQLVALPSETLLPAGQGDSFSLQTEGETLTFAAITKPLWAVTIGNDQRGLFVITEAATNERYRYNWHPPIASPQQGSNPGFWYPDVMETVPWTKLIGRDAFGLFADLTFKGITQRFRWIQPGAFMMGSPEDEPERYDNETQHQVILSQGYWLADTACTQALWQAVIGRNPSKFKNTLENPIEQVSWNAVQEFISGLNTGIPELNAYLPTEAQWEYACRAGTATRYSFGDKISAAQVNYAGNHGKTLPVKSLPANAWGLYEMHGNVWEWCQDWDGEYPTGTLTDPIGASQGSHRVLRGGSWHGNARYARSAARYGANPGIRDYGFGFRFVLLGQTAGHRTPEQDGIFSRFLKRIKPK